MKPRSSGRPAPSEPMSSAFYHAQAEMALKRVEIAVAMKQLVMVDDTKARDQRVDCLAHGDAALSEDSKVLCGGDGGVPPANPDPWQLIQFPARAMKVQVRAEALQDFGQDEIAEQRPLSGQQAIQQIGFAARPPVKVIDPDGAIYQDHVGSRRIASRSPSHLSLPRSRRIRSCCLMLTSRRSAASTASRLVFAPDARIARFIRSSSITILVRIANHLMCMLGLAPTHRKPWRRAPSRSKAAPARGTSNSPKTNGGGPAICATNSR